jgi:Cof subfamily protein (haloacid dehalogenase superfamily)
VSHGVNTHPRSADRVTSRARLIATDLDGTLLRSDGTVSDRSVAAIKAASAAGLLVVFVSGRPPRWLDDVADRTGHLGVAVGANGAVIYDMTTEQIISARWLEPDPLRSLARDIRARFPDVAFGAEYGDGFGAEAEYVHDWAINPTTASGRRIPAPYLGSLDDVLSRPALKLLVKDRGADVDEFLVATTELLAGRATVTHSSSFGLLELAAPGVDKGSGLAEVADSHGISAAEVVAIGDMPNDVPMLRWAGRSFAVGNAHPATKAAADAVVDRNDDDAVAALLESLIEDVD